MDNSYEMGADNKLLEDMIMKRKRGGNLAAEVAAKREKELASLRNIKSKIGLALVEDTPVSTKKPLTEAEVPILDFVSAVKKSSGSVNSEFEPTSLIWTPTTAETLKSLYPQANAISDFKMVLSGAFQQPGTAFALVGPGDARGGAFVKADASGKLFMAQASKNPKAFTNPGTNSDGDKDSDDKGRSIVPNPTPEAFANVLKVMQDKITCIETELATLKTTAITERKQLDLTGLDEKSLAVINRLLSMAKEIREGGSLPEKFDLPNKVTAPAVNPAKKAILTEKTLDVIEAATVIEEATSALQVLSTRKKTKQTEEVSTALTDLIAETLLTGNAHTKNYTETMNKFKTLVG